MSTVERHVRFVAALRSAGVPVSVAEDLDAAAALGLVGWAERERLRSTYAATVLKRESNRRAFDEVFDAFYPAAVTGVTSPTEQPPADAPPTVRDGPDALRALTEALAQGLAESDADAREATLARLAGEAVDRFGALPGRSPGQSGWSAYLTLRRVDPDALIGRLLAGAVTDQAQGEARIGRFRALVEADVRRRVALTRGPEHVAETFVRPPIERIDFMSASREEIAEMRRRIQPLARRLAVRAAREQHARRGGPLDFRRTVRAAMSTGGVPLSTRHRPRRPHRPELVVLCDVSGSVANFASFALMLLHALHEQFTRVRAFTFVDTVHEVTDLLVPGADPADVVADLIAHSDHASRWGRTDYGSVFAQVLAGHGDVLTPKTTLLVLGDARSNHADLRVPELREIRERVRRAWWLNPEAGRQWGTGDSAARTYAAVVPMTECRNLTQLEQFVHDVIG